MLDGKLLLFERDILASNKSEIGRVVEFVVAVAV